ncbi:MAG: serine--tRNA ligase, partial [Candidatus Saccharibacteria bacterium]|nr:serine--tRNA ligase [Candidatus Saccharibacteria bacterium]
MLDVKFIRENLELVERSAREKGYEVDIKEVLGLDAARKVELSGVEELRQKRNEIASKMKGGKPDPDLIAAGKDVKVRLAEKETRLAETENKLRALIKRVPNIIFDDVPLGGEEDSVEIKAWGDKKKEGVDHLDYAVSRDWVDFERGAKVAGAKFYYLKNELALLENALAQFGLKKVMERGFNFITVPDLVSSRVLEGTGFNPRTSDQS